MGKKRPILIVGDLHFPFCNKQKLRKMYTLIEGLDPSYVLQIGDILDCYSQSSFAKKAIDPELEYIQARKDAESFWEIIQLKCPNAKYYQLIGNHELRLKKKVRSMLNEMEHFFDLKNIMSFENVTTIYDEREPLELNNILFIHGWMSRPMSHLNYFNKSICFGHLHKGYINFKRLSNETIFEFCVGHLADESSYALGYVPTVKYDKWQHGFGVIDFVGNIAIPRFIPL